ncbi:hypothetical protein WDU94_003361 [Cyamophila willieti]
MKTKNKKNKKNLNKSLYCNFNLLQMELDNILITLIEQSAHLVQFDNVNEIFNEIVKTAKLDVKPDIVLLNKLTSMGYAVDRSKVALVLWENSLRLAVEWLTTASASVTDEDITELLSLEVNYESIRINPDNFCEFVKNEMRYLLKIREIKFETSKENINKIKKMGFQDEDQVKRALRKCSNEPNKACLFLLGETLDDPFSEHRPLPEFIDKILGDPDNLVALSNKNMFLALINSFVFPVSIFEYVQERKFTEHLVKIVEAFETEKYFCHGCREPGLFILMDANTLVITDDM